MAGYSTFGWFFNVPFLVTASDCLEFGRTKVCSALLGDCGPFWITGTTGSVTYFKAEVNSKFAPFITGKIFSQLFNYFLFDLQLISPRFKP